MSDNIIEFIYTKLADPYSPSFYSQYYPEYYDQNERSDTSKIQVIYFALNQNGPPPKGHENFRRVEGLLNKLYGKY